MKSLCSNNFMNLTSFIGLLAFKVIFMNLYEFSNLENNQRVAWVSADTWSVSGQVSEDRMTMEAGDQDLADTTESTSDFHQGSSEHVVQFPYFGNIWKVLIFISLNWIKRQGLPAV